MPAPQLSVRSARARDLAHMLAKRERRTVAQVVELALESYEQAATHLESRESWRDFLQRLQDLPHGQDEPDIDLSEVARAGRKPKSGVILE
jgi:hypothetical protein